MSIQENYEVFDTPIPYAYAFKSEGVKGVIWKAVLFQKDEGNIYNLAFGDIVGNDIDDKVISNNHDLKKVISTVVYIVYLFWEENPNAIIEISGVDEKRNRLYNSIFKRRYKELESIVEVYGIVEGQKYDYNPKHFYQKFEIQLKKI